MNTLHNLTEESMEALNPQVEEALEVGNLEPLLSLMQKAFEEKFEELADLIRKDPKANALGITAILLDHYGEELAKEKLTHIADSDK